MITKESVREIIQYHIDKVANKFNDYMCYEKYGEDKFRAKGFKPSDEDFRYCNRVLLPEQIDMATTKLFDFKPEVLLILKELIKTDTNKDVKKWARIIYKRLK